MYHDKRSDAEVFDALRRAHTGKSEATMAAEIRAHLTRDGGVLTQVRTDAPLSLTGQWDSRGSARGGLLVLLATWAIIALVAVSCAGCGPQQSANTEAVEVPRSERTVSRDMREYTFPNGTYCVQARYGDMPMQCDFAQRKLDNLEF